jgi:hypothetical protein
MRSSSFLPPPHSSLLADSRWWRLLKTHNRLRRYLLAISHQDSARSFHQWQSLTRTTVSKSLSNSQSDRRWNRLLIDGFSRWKSFTDSEKAQEMEDGSVHSALSPRGGDLPLSRCVINDLSNGKGRVISISNLRRVRSKWESRTWLQSKC